MSHMVYVMLHKAYMDIDIDYIYALCYCNITILREGVRHICGDSLEEFLYLL